MAGDNVLVSVFLNKLEMQKKSSFVCSRWCYFTNYSQTNLHKIFLIVKLWLNKKWIVWKATWAAFLFWWLVINKALNWRRICNKKYSQGRRCKKVEYFQHFLKWISWLPTISHIYTRSDDNSEIYIRYVSMTLLIYQFLYIRIISWATAEISFKQLTL